tara:strand:+ start:162 stop:314 length:153 start_codon:yes stop_codon:yes gene_type:complete
MINWGEILLFAFLAPGSIVFLFWLIDAIVARKWPFHDRNKKKINAGAKFG